MPKGRRQPLWWTLRRPFRPLNYQAAHRMFERANRLAGTTATLHALRHTAAYRMAEDPALPLTDVAVGARPRPALHDPGLLDPPQGGRGPSGAGPPRRPGPAAPPSGRRRPGPGLRPETLDVLFAGPPGDAARAPSPVQAPGRPNGQHGLPAQLGWHAPVPTPPAADGAGRRPCLAEQRCASWSPATALTPRGTTATRAGPPAPARLARGPAGPDLAGALAGQWGRRRRPGLAAGPAEWLERHGDWPRGQVPGRCPEALLALRRGRPPLALLAAAGAKGHRLGFDTVRDRDPDGFARLHLACDG